MPSTFPSKERAPASSFLAAVGYPSPRRLLQACRRATLFSPFVKNQLTSKFGTGMTRCAPPRRHALPDCMLTDTVSGQRMRTGALPYPPLPHVHLLVHSRSFTFKAPRNICSPVGRGARERFRAAAASPRFS
eukprot:scaffold15124_cov111-Isochrysis_galbana.AAC.1